VVGYFYAHVLKGHANEAYINLMWGKGDIVAGGVDWWWLKHIVVAGTLGMCITYFRKTSGVQQPLQIPGIMTYSIALLYLLFYLAMGMVMTWTFFWFMLAFGLGGAVLSLHLLNYHKGSGRAVYLVVGLASFLTVMLGGYAREASRPRFVDRISHYDNIFVPEERQPYLMLDIKPEDIPKTAALPKPAGPEELIRKRCIGCHTLDRVRTYSKENWDTVVRQMAVYGLKLSDEEREIIVAHLKAGKPY